MRNGAFLKGRLDLATFALSVYKLKFLCSEKCHWNKKDFSFFNISRNSLFKYIMNLRTFFQRYPKGSFITFVQPLNAPWMVCEVGSRINLIPALPFRGGREGGNENWEHSESNLSLTTNESSKSCMHLQSTHLYCCSAVLHKRNMSVLCERDF